MKLFKTTILLVMITMTMFSCTEKAQQTPPTQEFTYQGNTYNIAKAIISHESATKKTLIFADAGFSLNATNTEVNGYGNVVYFTINDASLTGVFYHNSASGYDDSEVKIGFDITNDTNLSESDINSGTITITPYNGGGYSVIVHDPAVNLTFEGVLEVATL